MKNNLLCSINYMKEGGGGGEGHRERERKEKRERENKIQKNEIKKNW